MAGIVVTLTGQDGTEFRIDDASSGESLMQAAKRHGVTGIIAECGGACSCATCHVYIAVEWFGEVGEPDDVEEAMLDLVEHIRRPTSRLSCQIEMHADLDGLVAEVAPEI